MAGDFLFAVASDDNSEFWLSEDENPDNLKLRAYVGKVGETSVNSTITFMQMHEMHILILCDSSIFRQAENGLPQGNMGNMPVRYQISFRK